MGRELMQHERPEEPVKHHADATVPIDAPLVELSMVAEIDLRKLPEGDVRLPPDPVPALENPCPFASLDVSGLVIPSVSHRFVIRITVRAVGFPFQGFDRVHGAVLQGVEQPIVVDGLHLAAMDANP